MQNSVFRDSRKRLRKEATKAEKILWPHLRKFRWHGYPIRRQYSIDPYIVDFYCPKTKLAIEIDGGIHDTDYQKQYEGKLNPLAIYN